MKKFLLPFLAALAFVANSWAATTVPVQLLNPTGSTAGQAVISSGSSSAPAWASLSATALAPIAANSLIGNKTGSSAAPTAISVPSCSTANSALQWTSGTGPACGTSFSLTSGNLSQFATTTSSQLAGVLSDETGSGVSVFGTSPTLTTPNIVGTATNNNAAAGSVGEYATNSATGVALTTSTNANIATLSLTAGDWDVEATTTITGAGGASITTTGASVSTTSATFGGLGSFWQSVTSGLGANGSLTQVTPTVRQSLSGTTTVFCVANATFSSGTASASCLIRARRVR